MLWMKRIRPLEHVAYITHSRTKWGKRWIWQQPLTILSGSTKCGAIQKAEFYTSAVDARRIAEALCSASLARTRTLDLKIGLETLLDFLSKLVPYDSACVILLRDETHLVVRDARGRQRGSDPQKGLFRTVDARTSSLLQELPTTG